MVVLVVVLWRLLLPRVCRDVGSWWSTTSVVQIAIGIRAAASSINVEM